jgi:hypothetical protein
MRILIPITVVSIVTIATGLAWRSSMMSSAGGRSRIMRVVLALCVLNVLLAGAFFWIEASIFGLHKSAMQLNERDFGLLMVMIHLASAGVFISLLITIGAIAARKGTARRWCVGVGVGMALIWLVFNLGYTEMLSVRTHNLQASAHQSAGLAGGSNLGWGKWPR